MNCPSCGTVLAIADRQGIEIDYCPSCRGVWLDRGELDKILERSLQAVPEAPREQRPVQSQAPPPPQYDYDRDRDRDRDHDKYRDDDYYKHGKRKRKEHWLSDIFDF